MSLNKIAFALSVAILLPLGAQADDGISMSVSKMLQARNFWISATFNYMQGSILFPIIQKKWRVENKKLVEITENSVRLSTSGTKEWMSEVVDLNGSIAFDRIATMPFANPVFRILSKSAFSISTPQGVVVFRSANSNDRLLPQTKGKFVHMWAPVASTLADLGVQSDFDPLPETPHPHQTALRHDLSKIRVIKVSADYPRNLLPALAKAVAQWNHVLARKFYVIGDVSMKLSQEQCLASRDLCIFWQGSQTHSWANYGALTSIVYDPAVGYILGGVITIYNVQTQTPTQQVPQDTLNGLANKNYGPYVAASIWAQPQFRDYLNPEPTGSITALFVHEMGHDHGFRHYFGGSLNAVPGKPSDTVMDYMPYPFFSHMQELGERDVAKVEALYHDGDFGTEFSPEMPCSDGDVLINPLCNPQDIGDPAVFYSSIVQSVGAFQEIKPTGGIAGVFTGPQPAVSFAARYLQPNFHVTTFQRAIAKNSICTNSDKDNILDYLLTMPSPVRLDCDSSILNDRREVR